MSSRYVPRYRGHEHVGGELPLLAEAWLHPDDESRYNSPVDALRWHTEPKPWVWSGERLYFFTDIHADTDALFRSLVASGGVAKTGAGDDDFELTEEGARARFVFGGDCFDKGPENLRLLRAIKGLIDRGAQVDVLAGNHDLRTLLGLASAGRKEVTLAHLFVRMGKKTIPLFREVWDQYLEGHVDERELLSDEEVRRAYFPDESWFDEFPAAVHDLIPELKLIKEVRRIREKMEDIGPACEKSGLTLGKVHAALEKARELFMTPGGEFAWYFERMNLALRVGSFLFVHAGVDDEMAALIRHEGVDGLNDLFHRMREDRLFELYNGTIGNMFRTKYRPVDRPLTYEGVLNMHRAGIYIIVHGHRNIEGGQRIVLRNGLVNFECDCSVDQNTRALESLDGAGGAATVFRPDGVVLGVSTDHPRVKVFDPAQYCDTITIVGGRRSADTDEGGRS
jgi:hypothetical protein